MTGIPLADYLQILNLLLLPLGVAAWRMSARLTRIEATLDAHASRSQERHDNVLRDLGRIEGTANAAHRRIDELQKDRA